jgi:hypothetical protein
VDHNKISNNGVQAVLKKVFLVEDEIVTREGIRDNMDWAAIGYEFCGEAPDGESALPLIEATQPHVIIHGGGFKVVPLRPIIFRDWYKLIPASELPPRWCI